MQTSKNVGFGVPMVVIVSHRKKKTGMLRLHNGHFDAWARLFRSVKDSWDAVQDRR